MTQATEEKERWPWLPMALRGELQMSIHSKLHAVELDLPMRTCAEFVGYVEPDDGRSFFISFVSAASARLFISEMAPRQVHVFVTEGEDRAALTEILLRNPDAPLH